MKLNFNYALLFLLLSCALKASTPEARTTKKIIKVLSNTDRCPILAFDLPTLNEACHHIGNPTILKHLLTIQHKAAIYCTQRISFFDEIETIQRIKPVKPEQPPLPHEEVTINEQRYSLLADLLEDCNALKALKPDNFVSTNREVRQLTLKIYLFLNCFKTFPCPGLALKPDVLPETEFFQEVTATIEKVQNERLLCEVLQQNFSGLNMLLTSIPQTQKAPFEHQYFYKIFTTPITYINQPNPNYGFYINEDIFETFNLFTFDKESELQAKLIRQTVFDAYPLYQNHLAPEFPESA